MKKILYLNNIAVVINAVTKPEIMVELQIKASMGTGAMVEILFDKDGVDQLKHVLNNKYKQLTFSTGNLHYKSTIKLPVTEDDKKQILDTIKQLIGE